MPVTPRSPHLYTFMSAGRLRRFSKGDDIPVHNDDFGLIMIVKGYVKRYMITNSGSLGVQIIYGPQDAFSLGRVLDRVLHQSLYDGPETYYYQAMSDLKVLTVNLSDLEQAANDDPLIYKELFGETGQHLKSCVHTIENISLGTAYNRVAHQLVYFRRNFGIKTSKGWELSVNLTHQDLADLLGTTRETVTVAMVKLRKEGLIGKGRKVCIPSLEILSDVAYG